MSKEAPLSFNDQRPMAIRRNIIWVLDGENNNTRQGRCSLCEENNTEETYLVFNLYNGLSPYVRMTYSDDFGPKLKNGYTHIKCGRTLLAAPKFAYKHQHNYHNKRRVELEDVKQLEAETPSTIPPSPPLEGYYLTFVASELKIPVARLTGLRNARPEIAYLLEEGKNNRWFIKAEHYGWLKQFFQTYP